MCASSTEHTLIAFGVFNMKGVLSNKIMLAGLLIIAFLIVGLSLVSIFFINTPGQRRGWESQARRALLLYGEAQLAYRKINNDRRFGSWDDLVNVGFIPEGYSREDIVDNYNLYIRTSNDHWQPYPRQSAFTAVAFPKMAEPEGFLSTFSIREDGVLRIYDRWNPENIPWGGQGDRGARTWDPVE